MTGPKRVTFNDIVFQNFIPSKDVEGIICCYLLGVIVSLDDVVVFFLNEALQGPVTDGTHGVVGDSRDEDGEELILTGLDDEALVVLGTGENLRHGMFALNTTIG